MCSCNDSLFACLRRYKLHCPYTQPCKLFLFHSINQYRVKVIFSDLSCTRVMEKNFKLFAQTWAPEELSFGCSQRPNAWLMNRALKLQGSKAQQEQNSSHVQSVSNLFLFYLQRVLSLYHSVNPDGKTDIVKPSRLAEIGSSLTSRKTHWSQMETTHFGSFWTCNFKHFQHNM